MVHPSVHTVSEAVARPVRGLVQSGPAFAVIEVIEAYELYDFTERQYAITLTVLTAVVSYIQNAYENHRGKGLFLRSIPPTRTTVEGA